MSDIDRALLKAENATTNELIAELQRYVVVEPKPFIVDLEKSSGMYIATLDGKRLFDWTGYYGSKLIEHNHPALYETEYLRRLARAANNKLANPDFLTEACVAYYRAIHAMAPRCMQNPDLEVYVVNSGAEAVENLMKYLINQHHARLLGEGKLPGAHRFVYFDQAFHGRTLFALNVTRLDHDPVMTKDFRGLMPGNVSVPFPAMNTDESEEINMERVDQCLKAVEAAFKAHGDEIVGVIVEPIQGAGGHRVAPIEFWRRLSELCHRYQIQLAFDEVQTAGGATGTFFTVDALDLPHPPHAIATGKKLGNGVVYMHHPMRDLGVLDSTWGGSLADMVRFVRELEVVRDEKLIEEVPAKSAHLVETLGELARSHESLIGNVRGYGIYQGFSLRDGPAKAALIRNALENEDLLLLGAGTDTIRLRPHLNVSHADIELLGHKLDRLLSKQSKA